MSIVKVVGIAVMFLNEKWHVAIRRPHKHITFLIKKGGTTILNICRDVTLLREDRFISVLRVSKVFRLLVQMGIFLY